MVAEDELKSIGSYICSDVIELGDESMFNDVNSNFWGDDHEDIGEQHPKMVWREKKKQDIINYIKLVV